jgi:hypothetical protein
MPLHPLQRINGPPSVSSAGYEFPGLIVERFECLGRQKLCGVREHGIVLGSASLQAGIYLIPKVSAGRRGLHQPGERVSQTHSLVPCQCALQGLPSLI